MFNIKEVSLCCEVQIYIKITLVKLYLCTRDKKRFRQSSLCSSGNWKHLLLQWVQVERLFHTPQLQKQIIQALPQNTHQKSNALHSPMSQQWIQSTNDENELLTFWYVWKSNIMYRKFPEMRFVKNSKKRGTMAWFLWWKLFEMSLKQLRWLVKGRRLLFQAGA